MMLLLAVPATFISTSVSRWLNSQTEESTPITASEEMTEEASVGTRTCRVVNRSSAIQCSLQAGRKPGLRRLGLVSVQRGAEHISQNGCGAVLRC